MRGPEHRLHVSETDQAIRAKDLSRYRYELELRLGVMVEVVGGLRFQSRERYNRCSTI